MGRLEAGKQYVADLLQRIPESERDHVASVLNTDDVAAFIGDGTLRQADYSRAHDELRAKHQELTTWYDQHKALFDAAVAAGIKPGQPAPSGVASTPTGVQMKDVEKVINEREQGAAAFIVAVQTLGFKHFQDFGEPLDVTALLSDPEASKIGLQGVYDRKFADRIRDKAQKAQDDLINQRVEARLVEERKKLGSAPPYPVTAGDPSPLDALEDPSKAPQFSAQAAADEYTALVARRMSGGAPA